MAIPEEKLEIWSGKGADVASKNTYESIKNALNSYKWPAGVDFKVKLQGSYKNNTNIRGDSDIDVVVCLNSTFHRDISGLSQSEQSSYKQNFSTATYQWADFKKDVLNALRDYYGVTSVKEGKKCLKVDGNSTRLNADVVVCIQHRKYLHFNDFNRKYVEGIALYVPSETRWIINYPDIHYDNGATKNNYARGNYKSTIRIFKNARTHLVNMGYINKELAPSYFIECLLYNVPNGYFGFNRQNTFINTIKWLADSFSDGSYLNFTCQNGQLPLFGTTSEQWSSSNAANLLTNLLELWGRW